MASLHDLARELAAGPAPDVLRVSAFVDLDPSTVPTAAAVDSHVRSVVDETRRAASTLTESYSHTAAMAAREDVERVVGFLEADLDRTGARGYAVYASASEDVFRTVPLAVPVVDDARIARSFRVAPLLPAIERERPLLLVAVGRERGTIWRRKGDGLTAVDDLSERIQSQHRQGGWSQANFERSRDKEAADHLRGVATRLGELVRPGSATLVVVSCTPEERPVFEDALEPHVRDAVLGWTSVEAHDDGTALLSEAAKLLDARRGEEHEALVARWREATGRDGRAVTGWPGVLREAWDGAVATLLSDGSTLDAWECPRCGRGSAEPGACDVDGSALEPYPGGALDVAVRGTLLHGGDARLVEGDRDVGVAALLRRPSFVG